MKQLLSQNVFPILMPRPTIVGVYVQAMENAAASMIHNSTLPLTFQNYILMNIRCTIKPVPHSNIIIQNHRRALHVANRGRGVQVA